MPDKARIHKPKEPAQSTEPRTEPVPEAPEAVEPGSDPVELEHTLTEAEEARDELLDRLQRMAADFDNYRKRVAREQEALVARAHAGLVEAILPVLDDLERALEAAAMHEEAKLEDGVRLVHRQLSGVLAREGLQEIPTGVPFDPHVHEALAAIPSESEEGTILEVVQRGYMLGDRVLRPARVIVAAASQEE
ncbi:MAG: nucleotide exchange factor GrpE [Gaiellaceae bacterium]